MDDYAHHPTELSATLEAARATMPPGGRVIAVFQPHRYSRTRKLYREFGPSPPRTPSCDRGLWRGGDASARRQREAHSGCDLRDARPPGRVLHSPARRDQRCCARSPSAATSCSPSAQATSNHAGEELLELLGTSRLKDLLRAFLLSAAVAALTPPPSSSSRT